MFKKVLVPLDGTECSEDILPYIEFILSRNHSAKVILLKVVQPEHQRANFRGSYIVDYEDEKRAVNDAFTYWGSVQKKLKAKGFNVETTIAEGSPVDGIVETAKNLDVDLIAMASHGRSGLSRAIHHSVASSVIDKAHRPIFWVRGNGHCNDEN